MLDGANKSHVDLGEDDLRKSLLLPYYKELGIEIHPDAKKFGCDLWGHGMPVLVIPYFTCDGAIARYLPTHPAYFRIRRLREPPPPPPGADDDFVELRQAKYWQPRASGVLPYFSRFSGIDWVKLRDDPDAPIVITEGEKKAACGCTRGIPVIGIGGVHSWHVSHLNQTLLIPLAEFNLIKRKIVILFDSDTPYKEQVLSAMNALADELTARGAYVHGAWFDAAPGDKIGLDDFIASGKSTADLREVIDRAPDYTINRDLFALNEKFCVVNEQAGVGDLRTGKILSVAEFKALHARKTVRSFKYTKEGRMVATRLSVGTAFMEFPFQRTYDAMIHAAGKPEEFTEEQPNGAKLAVYNTWKGLAVPAIKGPKTYFIDNFLKLHDHVTGDATPAEKQRFLQCLAYPIRSPGAKLHTALVIHSPGTGVGKSLLVDIVGMIYGQAYEKVNQNQIMGAFQSWAMSRNLICVDEMYGWEKEEISSRMKSLVTDPRISINLKFRHEQYMRNSINFIFTSNNSDAILIDNTDRRYDVYRARDARLPKPFYDGLASRAHDGGAAHLRYFFENDVDLQTFDPTAPAVATLAKTSMVEASQPPYVTWCMDMLADPDSRLCWKGAVCKGDLWTGTQLEKIYNAACDNQHDYVRRGRIARTLKNIGREPLMGGEPVRITDTFRDRFFAIRRAEFWAKNQSADRIRAHVIANTEKF